MVAAFLLNEFADHLGLERVEGKQDVPGQVSGTTWEIDGKGLKADGEAFIIIECRRYTDSRPNQEGARGARLSHSRYGRGGRNHRDAAWDSGRRGQNRVR